MRFFTISILIFCCSQVYGLANTQATDALSPKNTPSVLTETLDAQGEKDAKDPSLAPKNPTKLLTQVFLFIVALSIGGYILIHITKRGGLPLSSKKRRDGRLNICETRMLGNKQFLVVVEYGSRKVLLGVGPGMINHLCFLDNPSNTSFTREGMEGSVSDIAKEHLLK